MKTVVEKASARHEPIGSRPAGANSCVNLEVSASLSVTSRLRGILLVSIRAGRYTNVQVIVVVLLLLLLLLLHEQMPVGNNGIFK